MHAHVVVQVVVAAEDGWDVELVDSVRMSWSRRSASRLGARLFGSDTLEGALERARSLSSDLQTYVLGARETLAAWPRGDGPGELLAEPVPDPDGSFTPAELRGVKVEWWEAVADRAAFCPTRALVVAFCRPITAEHGLALWYWIPPKFRAAPDVFMSHAWDGSIFDIRQPASAKVKSLGRGA